MQGIEELQPVPLSADDESGVSHGRTYDKRFTATIAAATICRMISGRDGAGDTPMTN